MTIAEKLSSIKASKEAIKQAIEAKGVACEDVLSEYPKKIASIRADGIDMSTGIKFAYSEFSTEQFENLNTYNWDKISSLYRMFWGCENLTTIPQLDISNVTYMDCAFYGCSNLVTVSSLDTSKVSSLAQVFENCKNLVTVPLLDTSKVIYIFRLFYNCNKLTNLGGFKNLKTQLDLSSSPLLTVESLMNVINNLKDLTGDSAQTLTLGATNLAKLTDEQKAVATNKNWVLA